MPPNYSICPIPFHSTAPDVHTYAQAKCFGLLYKYDSWFASGITVL